MTQDELRHGAQLALMNAGRLVQDAITLQNAGRSPTALAIAVLAIEELGRRQMLLDLAATPSAGAAINPAQLRDRLDNHTEKLRRAQSIGHVTIPKSIRDKVGTAVERGDQAALLQAMRELSDAVKRKRQRDPDERHRRRMKALYVDPEDNGTWNSPDAITSAESYTLVEVAAAEYIDTLLQTTRQTPAVMDSMKEIAGLIRQLGEGASAGGA